MTKLSKNEVEEMVKSSVQDLYGQKIDKLIDMMDTFLEQQKNVSVLSLQNDFSKKFDVVETFDFYGTQITLKLITSKDNLEILSETKHLSDDIYSKLYTVKTKQLSRSIMKIDDYVPTIKESEIILSGMQMKVFEDLYDLYDNFSNKSKEKIENKKEVLEDIIGHFSELSRHSRKIKVNDKEITIVTLNKQEAEQVMLDSKINSDQEISAKSLKEDEGLLLRKYQFILKYVTKSIREIDGIEVLENEKQSFVEKMDLQTLLFLQEQCEALKKIHLKLEK